MELAVTDVRVSRSNPDRGIVTCEYSTVNQDGAVRQRTKGKILVFARPAN